MKKSILLLFILVGLNFSGFSTDQPRVFELRIYHTYEGRLDALLNRFKNNTMRIFVKHGMSNIAYWTPVDKPNTLYYIMAYPNMDARNASWKAFSNDPEWKEVAEKSQLDGKIVEKVESIFLNPTDFSPIQ